MELVPGRFNWRIIANSFLLIGLFVGFATVINKGSVPFFKRVIRLFTLSISTP